MVTRRQKGQAIHSALERSARRPVSLRLYIAGSTMHSSRALRTIIDACGAQLGTRYVLEVVDVYQEPDRAREDQIVALPTLIRTSPKPVQRFVGDLTNPSRVLRALGLVTSLHEYAKDPLATTKPSRR